MVKGDLGRVSLCKVQFNCHFRSLMKFPVKSPLVRCHLGEGTWRGAEIRWKHRSPGRQSSLCVARSSCAVLWRESHRLSVQIQAAPRYWFCNSIRPNRNSDVRSHGVNLASSLLPPSYDHKRCPQTFSNVSLWWKEEEITLCWEAVPRRVVVWGKIRCNTWMQVRVVIIGTQQTMIVL